MGHKIVLFKSFMSVPVETRYLGLCMDVDRDVFVADDSYQQQSFRVLLLVIIIIIIKTVIIYILQKANDTF